MRRNHRDNRHLSSTDPSPSLLPVFWAERSFKLNPLLDVLQGTSFEMFSGHERHYAYMWFNVREEGEPPLADHPKKLEKGIYADL